MRYKIIFFDLDGTLSDYKGTCDQLLIRLHAENPGAFNGITATQFQTTYWTFFNRMEEAQRKNLIDMVELQDREKRFGRVLQSLACDEAVIARYAPVLAEGYDLNRSTRPVIFPGARETLAGLHGRIALGVITQGSGRGQRRQLATLGLTDYFEHICISAEIGLKKPNPALFQACLDRAGVEGSAAVMVGDRVDWDLRPARAVGMSTVLFADNSLYYYPGLEDDPAVGGLAHNHAELLPLLLNLLEEA
jgi:putative hydrolase of the HAD superfamily